MIQYNGGVYYDPEKDLIYIIHLTQNSFSDPLQTMPPLYYEWSNKHRPSWFDERCLKKMVYLGEL